MPSGAVQAWLVAYRAGVDRNAYGEPLSSLQSSPIRRVGASGGHYVGASTMAFASGPSTGLYFHPVRLIDQADCYRSLSHSTCLMRSCTDAQRKKGFNLLHAGRKRIQGMVGQAVVLKYTPHLRFVMDESATRGNRVLDIIEDIEKTFPPHEDSSEDH